MRPVISIAKGTGPRCAAAPAFAALYRQLTEFLRATFPPVDNPFCKYPPATPDEFVTERFVTAPPFHQALATELWSLLHEISRDDRKVNGKTLHDHQFAHLIWVASSITDGPRSPLSFFIQGAPGTGKTLTLGVLMQACVRLQERGLMSEKIAYCTAKPYHLTDKVRGKSMGYRRILRAPPYALTDRDVNRRRSALCRIDGEFMKKYFPRRVWSTLFAQRPTTEAAARQLVDSYLDSAGLTVDDTHADMLSNAVKVLASCATAVRGPRGATELLTFPPIPDDPQQLASHTGDAAFAIPPGYPLFARESIGVSTATRGDARVILEPASVFTSVQQIERHKHELHRHVRVIMCDEAQRRQPLAFQEPVVAAGGADVPLVFAAGSQWYGKNWDRRSPAHSFPESIRRGILPDLGVRIFPSAPDTHYPAETDEALDQLLKVYFQPLHIFEQLGLPQPSHVNTLVVVHNRLVDVVVERLRETYRRHVPTAEVRPFHGGEEDREALQIWFESPNAGPNVLVSAAAIVKESLDLLSLRHLVVGTRVSADVLYHLIGRLAHGRGRRNRDDRMLVTLQQFANSTLAATPFVALDHGQSLPIDGFTWLNGHALMSPRAFAQDERRFRGGRPRDAVKVPGHGRRKRGQALPIAIACGKSILPNDEGRIIDPTLRGGAQSLANRYALVPVVAESYDPCKGPPSRDLARQWAAECGGLHLFENYPSIMLSVEEAHHLGSDPRQALEQKIARLRERSSGLGR